MTLGILALALAFSAAGTAMYRRAAIRRDIVARPNYRTLHERIVPRGGGVVFGLVFSTSALAAWLVGVVPGWAAVAFGVGAAGATAVGFYDDVHDVAPLRKFVSQGALALLGVGSLYASALRPTLGVAPGAMAVVALGLALFVPLWLVNMFNFIDGIDGLAVSAAVVMGGAVAGLLWQTGGAPELVFLAALIVAAALGFAWFNVPPARIFMGDAGSIFLGYSFAVLLLASVATGQLSIWTWLTLLGYYVGDTTTTSTLRLFMVRRWWAGHRSHAYQNLARVWQSHGKVTYGVLAYQLAWAVPLAVWSTRCEACGPWTTLLSVGPAVGWALRYGPLFSRD